MPRLVSLRPSLPASHGRASIQGPEPPLAAGTGSWPQPSSCASRGPRSREAHRAEQGCTWQRAPSQHFAWWVELRGAPDPKVFGAGGTVHVGRWRQGAPGPLWVAAAWGSLGPRPAAAWRCSGPPLFPPPPVSLNPLHFNDWGLLGSHPQRAAPARRGPRMQPPALRRAVPWARRGQAAWPACPGASGRAVSERWCLWGSGGRGGGFG